MPKILKINGEYDLKKSFYDNDSNRFDSGKNLVLWAQVDETAIVVDNSGKENTSVSVPTPLPPPEEFDLARTFKAITLEGQLGPTITNSDGLFSFSSVASGAAGTATSDLPFSVSFLAKPTKRNAAVKFIYKGASATQLEWSVGTNIVYDSVSNPRQMTLLFKIYDATGTNNNSVAVAFSGINTGADGLDFFTPGIYKKWSHIVCTYDGRGSSGVDPHDGMEIYINGELQPAVSLGRATQGTYVGMHPVYTDPVHLGGITTLQGNHSAAEFAIYNKMLSPTEVKALYNYTVKNSGEPASGYLNLPERVLLRQRDEATGSYPSKLRTTGRTSTLIGNRDLAFDDTRTIIYTNEREVQYPMMLRSSSVHIDDLVASPNAISSGSILAPANVKPFLSDQGISFSIDQRGRNSTWVDNGSPVNFEPFDESRIYIDNNDRWYLTGTSPGDYRNFSSPLDDKINIKIPLVSSEDSYASRYNALNLQNNGYNAANQIKVDQNSEFYNRQFSGFLYYNKDTKRWDDIGLKDPVTGHENYQTMYYGSYYFGENLWWWRDQGGEYSNADSGGSGVTRLPNHKKAYQFSMGGHTGFLATSYLDLKKMGYSHIGAPTVSGDAPWHSKYHATGSNSFKMSEFINHPFVFEKAVIDIPITVRMKNAHAYSGSHDYSGTGDATDALVYGATRDIDNYTFFIYRQSRSRNYINDSTFDASGSQRFLIASASVAAYNTVPWNNEVLKGVISNGLPHNPNIAIRLEHKVSGSNNAAGASAEFTGRITIKMQAAVGTGQFNGGSRFPTRQYGPSPSNASWSTTNNEITRYICPAGSLYVQDYWPGGTGFVSMSAHPHSGIGTLGWLPTPGATVSQMVNTQWVNTPSVYFADPASGDIDFFEPGMNFQGCVWPIVPGEVNQSNIMQKGVANTGIVWAASSISRNAEIPHYTFSTPEGFQPQLPEDQRPLRAAVGLRSSEEEAALSTFSTLAQDTNTRNMPITHGSLPISTVSPYVLLPDDEIIIGIDAGIASTMTTGTYGTGNPNDWNETFDKTNDRKGFPGTTSQEDISIISGSFLKVMTGDASITLFGSLIKENREKLFSLNQNLTSDAIHEDTGETIVSDQFLLSDRRQVSGSYCSQLVFGSMLAAERNTNRGNVNRGVFRRAQYGSFADVRYKARLADFYHQGNSGDGAYFIGGAVTGYAPSTYARKSVLMQEDRDGYRYWNAIRRYGARGSTSLKSAVQLIDYSEQIWDTIMPDIVDFGKRSGFIVGSTKGGRPFISGSINSYTSSITNKREGGLIGNSGSYSGPKFFSNIFAYPYKTDVPRKVIDNTNLLGNVNSIDGKCTNIENAGASTVNTQNCDKPGFEIFDGNRDSLARNVVLFKKGFRFNWEGKQTFLRVEYKDSERSLGEATGFAYGIENVVPSFTYAIFRKDSYGQFRDMLEQRKYGKIFARGQEKRSINSVGGDHGKAISEGFGEQDGVIINYFVQSSNGYIEVDPYTTQAGNVSLESSSSCPYADGHVCNIPSPNDRFNFIALSPYCVAEGTLIKTERGDVPVESLVKEDRVYSFDFSESGFGYFNIKGFRKSTNQRVFTITTEGGYSLTCTSTHPLVSPARDSEEIRISDMNIGDAVYVCDGDNIRVDTVSLIELVESECTVYNFEVEKVHSYISNGFLSHNMAMMTYNVTAPLQVYSMTAEIDAGSVDQKGAGRQLGAGPIPSMYA
tara:strand:+ start:6786 stop:11894 length:5109 start_codon:yes stop_codon:yes gene_type:complete